MGSLHSWRCALAAALVGLAVAAAGAAAAPQSEAPSGLVGVAKVDITPEGPVRMYGYGARKTESEGIAGRLKAAALALGSDAGEGPAVLLTVDCGAVPADIREQVLRRVQAKVPLKPERFMLCNSHNHSGPDLKGMPSMSGAELEHLRRYAAELTDRLEQVVLKALASRAPGQLAWTSGSVGFAANRRVLKDGKWSGFGAVPGAPVDHRLPLLRVTDAQGKLLAVVVNYACHNTTLQLDLQQRHPGLLAMFWIGCGADQNPLPRRSVALCQEYGSMLAGAVDEVLAKSLRPVPARIRTAFEVLDLPFGEQPTREKLEETAKKKDYEARWARRLLGELDAGRPWAKSYPYPVQVWKLGDGQLWIVLGGEVVVDYAIRFKNRYGPQTWVAGYANDVMSYIPSHRVWKEGRYESGAFSVYGLPAERWCEDIEDRIAACVERLAAKVK